MLQVSLIENHNLIEGWQGITCCHARLLKDILIYQKPCGFLMEEEISSIPEHYLNARLLQKAEDFHQNEIIQLSSKKNVYRFSVALETEAEIVTLFLLNRTGKKVITCQSGFCQSKLPHKTRTLESFLESQCLCPHLIKLRESIDLSNLEFDSEIFPEDNDVLIDDFDDLSMDEPVTAKAQVRISICI